MKDDFAPLCKLFTDYHANVAKFTKNIIPLCTNFVSLSRDGQIEGNYGLSVGTGEPPPPSTEAFIHNYTV